MPSIIRSRPSVSPDTAPTILVCGPENGLKKLTFELAWISDGVSLDGESGLGIASGAREIMVVPIHGFSVLHIARPGGKYLPPWRLERTSPPGPPSGVAYLPPGTLWRLEGNGESACVALVGCTLTSREVSPEAYPVFIPATAFSVRQVGRENWRREVRTFEGDGLVQPRRLIAGETVHCITGGWSSFPPHKHDFCGSGGERADTSERALEEFYYYRCFPPSSFGVQLVYRDGCESAFMVRDGDCVVIDRGYHPVVAAPGTILYYLWALAGDERVLGTSVDPDFLDVT